jgi:hypothetical protein
MRGQFSMMRTVFAAALLLHLPSVRAAANAARATETARLAGLGGDLVHPGLGLVLLLVILT